MTDKDKIVLQSSKFKLTTGEVSKKGQFLLAEEGSDSLHVGWWSTEMQAWTTEINESRFDVGTLYPIAKISPANPAECA